MTPEKKTFSLEFFKKQGAKGGYLHKPKKIGSEEARRIVKIRWEKAKETEKK